jgi:transposase
MLTRTILALERQLEQRTQTLTPRLLRLPGCGPVSAAKLLCEIGPIERFRSDAQLGVTPASRHWIAARASTNAERLLSVTAQHPDAKVERDAAPTK